MRRCERIEPDQSAPANCILGVPAADFPNASVALRPYFRSFERRSNGETTVRDLYGEVMAERRQVWIVSGPRACALTQVVGQVVEITHCAGEGYQDWVAELLETITAWAESIGATRIRVICRPGWTKSLKALGLKETHRVLERNIGQ